MELENRLDDTAPLLGTLFMGAAASQLQELIAALLRGGSSEARIEAAESALRKAGKRGRANIGKWVNQLVPVEALVPDVYAEWRPLVQDSLMYVFSHLSDARLAAKLVQQVDLPADTSPVQRLLALISKMPGIQKFGQIIARNRYLEPSLKAALSELENGLSDVDYNTVGAIITHQLGPALYDFAVEVTPRILVEASVSAVVQFTWRNPDSGRRELGVFKVRKPYVPRFFAEDMTLLQGLSQFLAKGGRYQKGIGEVSKTVAEVRLLLEHELDFVREQATLLEAYRTYRFTPGVRVPGPIPQLSTPVVTAMTEERGVKVTDAFRRSADGPPPHRRAVDRSAGGRAAAFPGRVRAATRGPACRKPVLRRSARAK